MVRQAASMRGLSQVVLDVLDSSLRMKRLAEYPVMYPWARYLKDLVDGVTSGPLLPFQVCTVLSTSSAATHLGLAGHTRAKHI